MDKGMRIAVFYDFLDQMGGGERMALQLCRHLNADLITTVVDKEKIRRMGFDDVKIISMPLPSGRALFKYPSVIARFALCDYSRQYDFFILAGRFTIFAAPRHKPNIYICADIAREFYDLRDFYNGRIGIALRPVHMLGAFLFGPTLQPFLKHVQEIVSISESNREKIKKYYGRDSVVVNPPVDCARNFCGENRGYWLSVNRFYPIKRIELQLEAFRQMPDKKLIVSGDYAEGDHSIGYMEKLQRLRPSNVEFRFADNQAELLALYAGCEGFVATSKEEAFGMAVVEAMASGKPVVAVNEGGFMETVLHGETGLLVNADPDEIALAVRSICGRSEEYRERCVKRARLFDAGIFLGRIGGMVYGNGNWNAKGIGNITEIGSVGKSKSIGNGRRSAGNGSRIPEKGQIRQLPREIRKFAIKEVM